MSNHVRANSKLYNKIFINYPPRQKSLLLLKKNIYCTVTAQKYGSPKNTREHDNEPTNTIHQYIGSQCLKEIKQSKKVSPAFSFFLVSFIFLKTTSFSAQNLAQTLHMLSKKYESACQHYHQSIFW